MAEGEFQVIFRGELVGDRPEETVKQQLAALFRMPESKVEALFSGKPVVVKRNLDEATARKFEAAFRKAGAVCELRGPGSDVSGAAAEGTREPAQAGPASASAATEPSAAAGTTAPASATAAAGDPNNTVLDLRVPETLEGLEIDSSDAPLAPPEDKAIPEIDTSELNLAEPGGNLAEPKKQPPPDIDTSGLEIEDADS